MMDARPQRPEIDWKALRQRLTRMLLTESATPDRVRAILEERARAAARPLAAAPSAGSLLEVIRMRIGGEEYALPTACVREVLKRCDIAPLPGAPDYLAGVANLRGQIVAVFDLRRLLGLSVAVEPTRIIVLGQDRIEFGILAESVDSVELVPGDIIKEAPASIQGVARELLRGVTADGVSLIDGAVLFDDPRFYIELADDEYDARP